MMHDLAHKLSKAAVYLTLLLVAFGGYTRGSGSGLGCNDEWPLCDNGLLGGFLPRLEAEMLIEWTHRWIALMLAVLALVLVYAVWKAALDVRWALLPAAAAVIAIGIQAWIGRLVVKGDLDHDLVTVHLITSMIIVALFVIVAVSTRPAPWGPHLLERDWSRQLGLGAVSVLLVLILGSVVHNTYVPGWPLVNGSFLVETSELNEATLHWLHRMASAAVLLYLTFLVWRCAHVDRPKSERSLVVGAASLYLVNIGLGLMHVLTQATSSWVTAAHLGAAGVVWAALITATFLSFHDPR